MLGLMYIFDFVFYCRNLWNHRTKIHRNLFIAMSIQVLVRLVVYIDQYLIRSVTDVAVRTWSIENTVSITYWLRILMYFQCTGEAIV